MKLSKKLRLMLFTLVLGVAVDQATKAIAVATLFEMQRHSFLGDTLRFQLTYNRGAFLSLGAGLPETLRQGLFVVATCLLVACALLYLLRSRTADRPVVIAVSLFITGGIGNLIDRIFHDGTVVDFLNVGVGSFRTGIFNIADMAIMGGAIMLFILTLRKEKNGQPNLS